MDGRLIGQEQTAFTERVEAHRPQRFRGASVRLSRCVRVSG